MAKNMLSSVEIIAVYEVLKLYAIKADSEGFQYKPGYNDEVIAEKMVFNCTRANVQRVRTENFGQFIKPPAPPTIEERFNALLTVVGYIANQSMSYKEAREKALSKLEELKGSNVSGKDTV